MRQDIDPALELERQRAENARLIALLESHGIEWRLPPPSSAASPSASQSPPESLRLSTQDKIDLFRRLFRGRTDVYPQRGNWSERVSITRRWIRWCWPCRSPGKARCSNMPVVSIASTPARPGCESSISSIPVTRRCCACGINGSAATGRWGIGCLNLSLAGDAGQGRACILPRTRGQRRNPIRVASRPGPAPPVRCGDAVCSSGQPVVRVPADL